MGARGVGGGVREVGRRMGRRMGRKRMLRWRMRRGIGRMKAEVGRKRLAKSKAFYPWMARIGTSRKLLNIQQAGQESRLLIVI